MEPLVPTCYKKPDKEETPHQPVLPASFKVRMGKLFDQIRTVDKTRLAKNWNDQATQRQCWLFWVRSFSIKGFDRYFNAQACLCRCSSEKVKKKQGKQERWEYM